MPNPLPVPTPDSEDETPSEAPDVVVEFRAVDEEGQPMQNVVIYVGRHCITTDAEGKTKLRVKPHESTLIGQPIAWRRGLHRFSSPHHVTMAKDGVMEAVLGIVSDE